MVGIGSREPRNLAVGEFMGKVRTLSSSLTCVTEIVIDILQRRWSEEEAATS